MAKEKAERNDMKNSKSAITFSFCPSTYETYPRWRFSAKKVKNFLKNSKTHSVGVKNPLLECVFCVRMIVTSFYHRLRDCRSARLVR